MILERCGATDVEALTAFLYDVDLTVSGLDAPSVRLWIERDKSGGIAGSTGYEISTDGRHALIRSVAVVPAQRSHGRGTALARFALERAREAGVTRAWLFSRRSGPFWQSLGLSRLIVTSLREHWLTRTRCISSSRPGNSIAK